MSYYVPTRKKIRFVQQVLVRPPSKYGYKNYGNPISSLGDTEYRLTTSILYVHFMQPVQRNDKRSFIVCTHYAVLPWQLRASRVLLFSRQKTCSHTYNCREYEGHAIVMVCSQSVPGIFFLAHMKPELRTKHIYLERGNLAFLWNGMSLLANMNPILSDKVIRKWLFVFM